MKFQDLFAYKKSFALAMKIFIELIKESEEVVKLINYMLQNPDKFGVKQ
jgi:hypothetical protein